MSDVGEVLSPFDDGLTVRGCLVTAAVATVFVLEYPFPGYHVCTPTLDSQFEVEDMITTRVHRGVVKINVSWLGLPSAYDSWEPARAMADYVPKLVLSELDKHTHTNTNTHTYTHTRTYIHTRTYTHT